MDQTCFDTAYKIVQHLVSQGFIAYFAGGWVRDFLMGHPSDDIDIATDASPHEVQELFEKTIPVGIQFGIVVVVLDGHQFEVATFRKDHGYEDGRRPIGIEKAAPKEDASRRDFTINGMFYDPISEKILDYVGGKNDLDKQLVKTIGNAHQRFLEDRLRMIRAIRYTCRFQFTLEVETQEAILTHANSLFPAVAIERVWQEFTKMAKFGNFEDFLILLHKVHLLKTIFPNLENISQNQFDQTLQSLREYPKNCPIIIKLCKLLSIDFPEEAINLCEKLKISNSNKALVNYYYLLKNALLQPMENLDDFKLAYLYAHEKFTLCFEILTQEISEKLLNQFLEFHKEKQSALEGAISRIKDKSPLVTSKHLLDVGISPGVTMGKLLKECEKTAINEKLNNVEDVIKRVKQSPLWP